MANINSISSNSYSASSTNLYGSRNVLTGLASGMDTEALIQNSVSGYQTKITELQQSTTKLEWKQDAYRALTDQMYAINQKYMSYTSKTNLSSNSFFTSARTTEAQGTNASALTASGQAKSDIQINAVKQLATSARYAVDASSLSVKTTSTPVGEAIDWSHQETIGLVKGSMTLKYGNDSIELKFDEKDNEISSAEELKAALDKKLADVQVNGKSAYSLIECNVSEDGTFTIKSKGSGGNSVYINSVSGNVSELLGATKPASTNLDDKLQNTSFTVSNFDALTKEQNMVSYLSGKTLDVTLDGVTRQIKISDLTDKTVTFNSVDDDRNPITKTKKISEMTAADMKQASDQISELLRDDIQASINKTFGTNRVKVGLTDPKMLFEENGAISMESRGLTFDVAEGSGSTIKVSSSDVGEKLGLGKAGVSNYFNTSNTLEALLGDELNGMRIKAAEGDIDTENVQYYDKDGNRLAKEGDTYYKADSKGNAIVKDGEKTEGKFDHAAYTDAEGKLVMQREDGNYYRVNEKGEDLYSMEINGVTIDGFSKSTALESVLNKINSNVDVGVNVSYSSLTSQFVFTARETGEGGKIEFGDGLAQKLFTSAKGNDPQTKTVGDLFGDAFEWNSSGNATLEVRTPAGYYTLGVIGKNDSVESLMQLFETKGDGFIKNRLSYDSASDTYQLVNSDGSEMDDETAQEISFNVRGHRDSSINFASLLKNANAMTGFTAGTDAVVDATVNGKQLTLQRSSNVVDMDGLSLTLKDTFSAYGTDGKLVKGDAVTFTTKTNSDEIVDVVKSFVEDVNKLMNDIHSAYATQPAEKSSTKHTKYEPLTDDDKKDMSESAIAAYEEKAKQGILFGDTDLSSLYGKLRDAIQSFGTDRVDMKEIGLETAYSGGVTTLKLDESKLRSMLDSDPDKVRNVFTKTTDGGSATNGLIANLKTTINAYASTSIATPGILVRKAGTKLSSMSLLSNDVQKQIDNVNKQIENWQTKLSSKIDYYTKQFTALEKLMSTMNNQSSMLSDLMGY